VSPQPLEWLETQRLLLRRYLVSDAPWVSEAIEESRTVLERWTPEIASRRSAEEVAIGLQSLDQAWRDSRKLVYGMYDRSTARFQGEVGLYTIDWSSSAATIGVWLREGARGRGLAQEGFAALAGYAQERLGLTRLDAHIRPDNDPSRRLAERTGFTLSGTVPGLRTRDGTEGPMLVYRRELRRLG
jgi:ribosomal-protein-serine acetyltransferase